jgi:hypothetical protein
MSNAMMGKFNNINTPPMNDSNESNSPAVRAIDLLAASWFTLPELKRKQIAPIKLTMMHVQTKIAIKKFYHCNFLVLKKGMESFYYKYVLSK